MCGQCAIGNPTQYRVFADPEVTSDIGQDRPRFECRHALLYGVLLPRVGHPGKSSAGLATSRATVHVAEIGLYDWIHPDDDDKTVVPAARTLMASRTFDDALVVT